MTDGNLQFVCLFVLDMSEAVRAAAQLSCEGNPDLCERRIHTPITLGSLESYFLPSQEPETSAARI